MERQKLPLRGWTVLFVTTFIANFIIGNFTISSLLLVISSVALFGIILEIKLKDNSNYLMMRKLSTVIYLIHMYVWTFYYMIVYREKTFGWDCFIVTTLISFIIGLMYYQFEKNKCNIRRPKNM